MEIYISPGNRRMDIPTFSLPAVKTCPGSTELCKKNCYALKAEKVWKGPKQSRNRNYDISMTKEFVDKMIHKISKSNKEYFRVHESGDFYSQEYLDKWIKIFEEFNIEDKKKKFLIYTQKYDLDYSKLPSNVILYWTIWPDTDIDKVPEGLRAYVIDDGTGKIPENTYIINEPKICKKGKGSKLKCDDCMYCYEGRGDVVFILH